MNEPKKHWLMRAESIRLLWKWFIAILAVAVFSEFLIHKHEHFAIDGTFGFHAWYGFVTCAAMVVGAKVLGYVLKRGEDYYDD